MAQKNSSLEPGMAYPSTECWFCKKPIRPFATLTDRGGHSELLDDDPIVIQHDDIEGFVHKTCGRLWLDGRVGPTPSLAVPIGPPNVLGQDGDAFYMPPDTPVELVDVGPEQRDFDEALDKETDRGVILAYSGRFEVVLERLLARHFIGGVADKLLQERGPVSGLDAPRITPPSWARPERRRRSRVGVA